MRMILSRTIQTKNGLCPSTSMAKNHLYQPRSSFNLLPLLHHSLIHFAIPLSLNNIINLPTISSFHSSLSDPPFYRPFQHLPSCILSLIDWTCQLDGAAVSDFTLWKLQMYSLELYFLHWCRKHAGLQAETQAWHHPPRRLSKLSSTSKFSLHNKGVVDTPLTISV